jgi:phospholipase C
MTGEGKANASRTTLRLEPGESGSRSWSLERTRGWYDLTISIESDSQFEARYAGHLEDGEDSISDPLMGGLL